MPGGGEEIWPPRGSRIAQQREGGATAGRDGQEVRPGGGGVPLPPPPPRLLPSENGSGEPVAVGELPGCRHFKAGGTAAAGPAILWVRGGAARLGLHLWGGARPRCGRVKVLGCPVAALGPLGLDAPTGLGPYAGGGAVEAAGAVAVGGCENRLFCRSVSLFVLGVYLGYR